MYSFTQRFRPVFQALREAGVDVDQALARLDLSEAQLVDPSCRVPRERVVELTGQLIWMAGEPSLGVTAAERFVLPDIGVLGYLMRHVATPLDALTQLSRFQRLIADAADLRVDERDGKVTIRAGLVAQRPTVPPAVDFSIGIIVQSIRQLTGRATEPRSVLLPRPRPRELTPYHRFFGSNVRFEAEEAQIVYDSTVLRGPCVEADPKLAGILGQHARMLMASLPSPSNFIEQVRAVVEQQLARGAFSLPEVAEELGLSERTLRRKLAQLGSSFRDVLDRARCDHAIISLNEGKLSVTEIAYRIGFADATAFTRSFRRWTGKTPAEVVRERAAARREAPPQMKQHVATGKRARGGLARAKTAASR